MSDRALAYGGNELELFAEATNWKRYVARHISRFITGRVLEVGAGIGSNITQLIHAKVQDWLALEPDAELAGEIERRLRQNTLPSQCRVQVGTTADIPPHRAFDTILYIDVLEHIEDDRGEVARAAALLRPGGRIVVLGPAHQFLYSPFDQSIGHFRRYNLMSLERLTPDGCVVEAGFMLDSIGFFASLANRFVLRSAMPTKAQIATWDRTIVPLSRLVDPLSCYRFGKSAVMVWRPVDQHRVP